MSDAPGPTVLSLWCAVGHQLGSLVDVFIDDSLATYVPAGEGPQSWPPILRATGRRATWITHHCTACCTEFGNSVDTLLSALHVVKSDPPKSTADFPLAPARDDAHAASIPSGRHWMPAAAG